MTGLTQGVNADIGENGLFSPLSPSYLSPSALLLVFFLLPLSICAKTRKGNEVYFSGSSGGDLAVSWHGSFCSEKTPA